MARSDLLLGVVKAGLNGDSERLQRTVEAIIVEERAKQHNVLAERLENILRRSSFEQPKGKEMFGRSIVDKRISNLIHEIMPQKKLEDVILPEQVKKHCLDFVQEQLQRDLLRSYNLEPRNRMLLIGPPGNGKTTLAEAVAESLMVPLFVVRYETLIGAYLGETSGRLGKLIEHVRTRECVLFFDEFETLSKERGDGHESGEMKRVVSSLLLQIDNLPTHVTIIAATNHPEMLDRAAWRRFQLRIDIPPPDSEKLVEWLQAFEKKAGTHLGVSKYVLAKKMLGRSFAEVEEFALSALRKYILHRPEFTMEQIVKESMETWESQTASLNGVKGA